MHQKLKKWLINSALVLVILGVWLIGYLVMVAGPNRAYEKEDAQYVRAFEASKNLKSVHLETRFSFDRVYYIVSDETRETLYWFNREMTEQGERAYVPLDRFKGWLESESLAYDTVSYGVYKDEIVYTQTIGDHEYFYNTDTFELILKLGG